MYIIYGWIWKYLSNYIKTIIRAEGRLLNNIHFTFGKYLLIVIHYYVILPY